MNYKLNTVFFDLDDTLHDDTVTVQEAAAETAIYVAQDRDVDPRRLQSQFIKVLFSFWADYDPARLEPGTNVRALMWADALAALGIPDRELANECAKIFEENRKKHYKVYPAAIVMLEKLRQRGIRRGLITNGLRVTHAEKLELLRIADHVDAIFLSDDVGASKPDPAIFHHACREMGTTPARCAMVGDRYDRDVAGALGVGMLGIWLNVRGESAPPGAPAPTFQIGEIDQAYTVLEPLLERK